MWQQLRIRPCRIRSGTLGPSPHRRIPLRAETPVESPNQLQEGL